MAGTNGIDAADVSLAVVIPTRDRRAALERTLAALDAQEGIAPFEVVVVDDGSRDGTQAMLAEARYPRFRLRAERQPPRGPAVARNRGIAAARAERILLLGDDTWPAPGTVRAHLDAAGGREVGVQGRIEWDPELEITPVMRFLAPAGPQFYFAGLEDGRPIPYTAVLGSNFSAPAAWFRDQPFDETFADASFEDTELAYRWHRLGRHSIYRADALCWHRHAYRRLEPFLERQRRAGRAARYAVGRHPGLLWRTVAQPTMIGGARHIWRLAWRRLTGRSHRQIIWDLRCRLAFLRGFLRPAAGVPAAGGPAAGIPAAGDDVTSR